jgi:hypothetical protein
MSDLPGGSGWQQPGPPPVAGGYGAPPSGPGGPVPPVGWSTPYPPSPPRPGIIPLRPLGLGELLDGAITCIRTQPRLMLGLAAVVVTTQQVIQAVAIFGFGNFPAFGSDAFNSNSSGPDFSLLTAFTSPAGLVAIAVSAVFSALLAGAVSAVVGEAILGRRATLATIRTRLRRRVWSLLAASVLAGLLPFLGLVGFIVFGVFLWGALSLTTPAVVLERIGPFRALRRSWQLAVPSWWRVFGIRALSALLGQVIGSVLAVPFTAIGIGVLVVTHASGVGQFVLVALAVVGGIIGGTITAPFLTAVLTLIYVDQRMRREGLDLVLARAAAAPAYLRAGP